MYETHINKTQNFHVQNLWKNIFCTNIILLNCDLGSLWGMQYKNKSMQKPNPHYRKSHYDNNVF